MKKENDNKNTGKILIPLEKQLIFPMYLCSKEVIRIYSTLLRKVDLTYTQFVVMMYFPDSFMETAVTSESRDTWQPASARAVFQALVTSDALSLTGKALRPLSILTGQPKSVISRIVSCGERRAMS